MFYVSSVFKDSCKFPIIITVFLSSLFGRCSFQRFILAFLSFTLNKHKLIGVGSVIQDPPLTIFLSSTQDRCSFQFYPFVLIDNFYSQQTEAYLCTCTLMSSRSFILVLFVALLQFSVLVFRLCTFYSSTKSRLSLRVCFLRSSRCYIFILFVRLL